MNATRATRIGDLIAACRSIRRAESGYIRRLDAARQPSGPILYEYSHSPLKGGYSCDTASAREWIDYYESIPDAPERKAFLAIPVDMLIRVIDSATDA